MAEKEIRLLSNYINLRASGDTENRGVEGYALVFNRLSEDLGGFRELIDPAALDNDVLKISDVFALLNHDQKRGILGRCKKGKGTLRLKIDNTGLAYSFDSPNTSLGDELLEYLKRGDIDSSSFAFTVSADKWDKQQDGTYIRTITAINQLFDVSPVFQPAYSQTSVKCARFVEIQEAEKAENERKMKEADERAKAEEAEAAEKRKKEIEDYYINLEKSYKK